jgi:hypothetical protein
MSVYNAMVQQFHSNSIHHANPGAEESQKIFLADFSTVLLFDFASGYSKIQLRCCLQIVNVTNQQITLSLSLQ